MSEHVKNEGVLLPCPFCGGKPKWKLNKVQHCQLHGEPYQTTTLKCCVVVITKDTKEECFEVWQTRTEK